MKESENPKEIEFPTSAGVLAPSDHSPKGLRAWISETCRYLGVSPTEFAKYASLAPSTINRFLRNLDEANLSARTIEALLETARKIEIEALLETAGKIVKGVDFIDAPYLTDVAVLGDLAAGSFRPYKAWTGPLYRLRLPIRAPFHRAKMGAFEVSDDHAAPIFPKGSIVVVSPFSPTNLEPLDGEYIAIFRHGDGPNKGLMEYTIRRFVVSPSGGAWLVTINSKSGIDDVFLGDMATYRNEDLNIHKRPHALVIQSIQFHDRRKLALAK
jgi:hypothetical protein